MSKIPAPLLLVCLLSACSTSHSPSMAAPASTQDRLGKAIVSPLNDFNLMQDEIPPVITAALKNPYQIPAALDCSTLAEQITELNNALGADLDAIHTKDEKSYTEKGGVFVQDEAIGSVERTINGAIPFRSWIRKFTGAEKHSKEMATAIAAGIVRRAFLKGIGQEHGCQPPAAPIPPVPEETPAISKQ